LKPQRKEKVHHNIYYWTDIHPSGCLKWLSHIYYHKTTLDQNKNRLFIYLFAYHIYFGKKVFIQSILNALLTFKLSSKKQNSYNKLLLRIFVEWLEQFFVIFKTQSQMPSES
jgi:hypothetical protein